MMENVKKIFGKKYKLIDKNILPSQNLFYEEDMKIYIKKATYSDINIFKGYYKNQDVLSILSGIRFIVENNVKVKNNNYSYKDILSTDMLYLFFLIVSYTKEEPIVIYYEDIEIEFNEKTFDYFDISKYMQYYDGKRKVFKINGYEYSLPTNGIEEAVTEFIYTNHTENIDTYQNMDYYFQYFLTEKSELTYTEITNMLEIFNNDMTEKSKEEIENIIEEFSPFTKYALKTPNNVQVPLDGVDLEHIFGFED